MVPRRAKRSRSEGKRKREPQHRFVKRAMFVPPYLLFHEEKIGLDEGKKNSMI